MSEMSFKRQRVYQEAKGGWSEQVKGRKHLKIPSLGFT